MLMTQLKYSYAVINTKFSTNHPLGRNLGLIITPAQVLTFNFWNKKDIKNIPFVTFLNIFSLQSGFGFIKLILIHAVWHGVKLWGDSWNCIRSMVSIKVLILKGWWRCQVMIWEKEELRNHILNNFWHLFMLNTWCDITHRDVWSGHLYISNSHKSKKSELNVQTMV